MIFFFFSFLKKTLPLGDIRLLVAYEKDRGVFLLYFDFLFFFFMLFYFFVHVSTTFITTNRLRLDLLAQKDKLVKSKWYVVVGGEVPETE